MTTASADERVSHHFNPVPFYPCDRLIIILETDMSGAERVKDENKNGNENRTAC